MRDLLPDEADELLKGRVQVINLWRPIKGPLQDAPLALCDARTVDPRMISWRRTSSTRTASARPIRSPTTRRIAGTTRRSCGRDEALLLKIMDTKNDGRARFMPHTSFTDPTTPADAFPRESIELRTLVFHPA